MSPTSVVTAPPQTTAPAAESNLGAAQPVAAEIVPGADLAAAPRTPESTFVVTYPLVVTESVFVAEPTPSSILVAPVQFVRVLGLASSNQTPNISQTYMLAI